MGVEQIICAVNKMDSSEISDKQSRFNEIQEIMRSILQKIGFNPDKITFIPVSGWRSDNIFSKWSQKYPQHAKNMPWYKGVTLLEALESLSCPKRLSDEPLRVIV